MNPPNIELILADDMGCECLSCWGSTFSHTQALDALVARGLRFVHCYSPPLCMPSWVKIRPAGIISGITLSSKHSIRTNKPSATWCSSPVTPPVSPGNGSWRHGTKGSGTYPKRAEFDEYCLWQFNKRQGRYADPLLYNNSTEPEVYEGEYGPVIFTEFINGFIESNVRIFC